MLLLLVLCCWWFVVVVVVVVDVVVDVVVVVAAVLRSCFRSDLTTTLNVPATKETARRRRMLMRGSNAECFKPPAWLMTLFVYLKVMNFNIRQRLNRLFGAGVHPHPSGAAAVGGPRGGARRGVPGVQLHRLPGAFQLRSLWRIPTAAVS